MNRKRNPEDSLVHSIPEPEVRNAVVIEIERELARRSISGALVYFVVSAVLALSTPYSSDHPATLILVANLTLLFGLSRIISARHLSTLPSNNNLRIRRVFLCSIYGTAITWGAFCAWTVHLYKDDWTAMFLLLITAALSAGMSSSLAPSLGLAWRCLVIVIGPTILSSMVLGGRRQGGLAVLTSIYLGFLIAQARGNSKAFQSATVAAERERVRGSAERRRAEQERARLVGAIEQAAEEILITDVDGNIQYCNPAFEKITGYSRSEVLGRNPKFLKSGTHDVEFYRALWGTIKRGSVWTGHITNRKKDGSLYEADGTISPIHDIAGKLIGFVSARHDVTEQLRLESQLRQAQKMESVGRLAGGVAHDFNNLLTVIVGYSCTLQRQFTATDPRLGSINEIRKAGERAATLTQQLLAFSRQQIIQPKPIDLNTLISDIEQMLRRLVGEDIELITVLAPSLALVMADADQMNQVLMNLAANSRDAMPRGGRLTLSTANIQRPEKFSGDGSEPSGPAVLLTVSDTGIGMDEPTRQHIFEPFFTTKVLGRGTGLGLSTVYGILQQNKGWIEVQSELGRGTTFKIYLPRIDPSIPADETIQETASAMAEEKLEEELGIGSATILVAEDDDMIRGLVQTVLAKKGYTVLSARDPREAIRIHQQYSGPIDLLLTDMVMPHMNGRELAEHLAPDRPQMRVLFMSGYIEDATRHQGALTPGTDLLKKPFSPTALLREVYRVLKPSRDAFTILIVDDHAAIRNLIRTVLEEAGYRILEAGDAKEVVAHLGEAKIHLVITDSNLPGQSGGELVKTVKAQHPDIKLILMSGSFESSQTTLAKGIGLHTVLPKPVKPETLLETVRGLLG